MCGSMWFWPSKMHFVIDNFEAYNYVSNSKLQSHRSFIRLQHVPLQARKQQQRNIAQYNDCQPRSESLPLMTSFKTNPLFFQASCGEC
jgi:hypothetical protein